MITKKSVAKNPTLKWGRQFRVQTVITATATDPVGCVDDS